MIEELYAMPFFLLRHREGIFGPHVDDLADSLVAKGYTWHAIRGVLRGTRAFGEWLTAHGHGVDDVDDSLVARFAATVRCSKWTRRSYRAGARHVLDYLRSKGVITEAPPPPPDHQIVIEFSAWMTEHRGVRATTVNGYLFLVRELLQALRGDVGQSHGSPPSRIRSPSRGAAWSRARLQRRHGDEDVCAVPGGLGSVRRSSRGGGARNRVLAGNLGASPFDSPTMSSA